MKKAVWGIGAIVLALIVGTMFRHEAFAAQPSTQPSMSVVASTWQPLSLRAIDLQSIVHPIGQAATRPVALVFLGTECPISRRYIPTLNDLAKSANAGNIQLLGVISDPTVGRAAADQFVRDYAVSFPMLLDASGELAKALKPAITPQAFVIDTAGSVLYSGRIDDWYASVARQKQQADHHELSDAIVSISAGKIPAVKETQAVGCVFESWDKPRASAKITYTRNVAPILMANCVSCHHAGEVAPFALTSYNDAAKRAKQIAMVTSQKFMPPWKATAGFGHFADERRLSDDEIATLSAWASAAAPQGDAADLLDTPSFPSGWRLGKPDVVVKMPKALDIPASGKDVYRAFVLPLNIPMNSYVAGFEFSPGASTVVHHALIFLDNTGAARKLESANTDNEPGYKTFGGVGFNPTGGLGGWAPGATPYLLPPDTGKILQKNSDVVLQVHYHPDGKPHTDQSSIAIYFAKGNVTHVIGSLPLIDRHIDIAAGDAHYVKDITMTLPLDMTFDGITPHMHLLGREMKVTATKPDGTVIPMIWIKDWDFRWQDQYRYAEPVKLPKGTRLDLHAVYDNSADNPSNPNDPPKRVTFGEQTTDEMCICFLSFVADSPAQLKEIRQQIMRQRLIDALSGQR